MKTTMKTNCLLLAFALIAIASIAATAQNPALPKGVERVTSVEGITEYRLANGLRVLLRLGFGEQKKSYMVTYRAVQEAIHSQLKQDYDWLISAHVLLRQHGKELCKTNAPLCEKCPVRKSCAYFKSAFG